MRDEYAGDVQLVMQASQPATQLLTHLCVERAERLVQQQYLRLDSEGARQCYTLALSAGKLCGVTVGEPVQLHEI